MDNSRERDNRRDRRRNPDLEDTRRSPLEVGVFCETAPLKKLSLWGPPGNEALLAQYLPKEISLFVSNFDVFEARREYSRLKSLLEENGIALIEIRRIVANRLIKERGREVFPQTKEETIEAVVQRAIFFGKKYRVESVVDKQSIRQIFEEDISDLGLKRAIALNSILCLEEELPMANIVFAKDQISVIGNHLFFSKMAWEIRQPEVELYELAYEALGLKNVHFLEKKNSSLEGGDVIVFRGTCYIGTGIRTTQEAALEVFEKLRQAGDRGIENFVIVANPEQEKKREKAKRTGEKPEIKCMHLDTFWMPASEDVIICCLEEARKRIARLVDFDQEGSAFIAQETPFTDYLDKLGVKIVNVSHKEQVNHGTNFINLANRKAVISLSSNSSILMEMNKKGIETIPADIFELAKAGGGVHCLTSALLRERV